MSLSKTSKGWVVLSKAGKRLTKPKSKKGALKDLRRIEYWKHKKK